MTRKEAIEELKGRFFYLKLPFQNEYYEGTLTEALRKFATNSGKTRTIFHAGADALVDLSTNGYVRVVTQVLPSSVNLQTSQATFNPWDNNILVTGGVGGGMAGSNFYVRNMEDILIRQIWSQQMSQENAFDWWWDPDKKLLSINQGSLPNCDGFLIQFLPNWKEYWDASGGTGELGDETVIDWVLDYGEFMIREDIGRILKSGSIYDLPEDGGDMLDEAKEELGDLEKKARMDSPLLGMSQ